MIDPHRTGAYISRLRKDKDWTQLDLAEKLHVTHQAVSRWEKGETFPDIALLPQVATLFGISVDDLLNGEPTPRPFGRHTTAGNVIEALAQGRTQEVARMVQEDPEDVEAVIEAAPLARPSVMNQVARDMKGIKLTLKQVSELAPFVDSEVLEEMLIGSDDGGPINGEMVVNLAPFLHQSAVDRLVARLADGEFDLHLFGELAPFVSKEALDGLVKRVEDGEIPVDALSELAPFLSQESLDRLVEKAGEGPVGMGAIGELAPFLSQKALRRLVERAAEGEIEADAVVELAPFLDQETLNGLVERVGEGKLDARYLGELAPFLGQPALDRLVERIGEGQVDARHLEELAPFLSQAGLKRLIGYVAEGQLDADVIVSLAPFLDKQTLADLIRGARK
jgi:transcriptional regulator with XRE-family HTH domain